MELKELPKQLPVQIQQARQNVEALNRKALGLIREYPGACLLGAIALGFGVGHLASRRWRA